jgi:hypothetical protein
MEYSDIFSLATIMLQISEYFLKLKRGKCQKG